MDLRIADKVAVVTGGASGIGLATAQQLLSEGAKVAICARGVERLEAAKADLIEEFGERVFAMSCDVTDRDAVEKFSGGVVAHFGSVDMLINNAGNGRQSTYENTTDQQWRDEMELKIFSMLYPTRAFLPALEKSDVRSIVCVSAMLGNEPLTGMIATSAARAGLNNLAKSLSIEFAPKNIRVNTVLLGIVNVGQWKKRYDAIDNPELGLDDWLSLQAQNLDIPMGRLGQPDEPARVITFLASPAASYMTGAQVSVTGGRGGHI